MGRIKIHHVLSIIARNGGCASVHEILTDIRWFIDPSYDEKRLYKLLWRAVRKGLLRREKRGVYCIAERAKEVVTTA